MNATIKSLIFWAVLIVVGVGIWNFLQVRADRGRTGRGRAARRRAGRRRDPEAKLKELGITLPTPSAPIANYVNAVQTGNLLFLAGKGPLPQDGKEVRRPARQGHDHRAGLRRRRAPSRSPISRCSRRSSAISSASCGSSKSSAW